MNPTGKIKRWKVVTLAFAAFGLMAIHNQQLAVNDPENTYFNKISRTFRLLLNPPENELEEHLIGKNITCKNSQALYNKVAAATVVIFVDQGFGAGVFIGPRLIVTADHVVDGKRVILVLPKVTVDGLAHPGLVSKIDSLIRVDQLDLAFIKTKEPYPHWLPLQTTNKIKDELMVVGHPNRKFFSLQKARVKRQELIRSSDYIYFKDNEVFFGNSGGAIVDCEGQLAGIVSMMANYRNSRQKQGIGINSQAIADFVEKLKLAG
ncbi:MAG: serine protease [Nitrospinota bacterium]|nr:serine protease [Nitrospinota bacterium]